ncbi:MULTISPECIES: hypothetical protein [unclassified Azospirillum]|jgi:translation elongation factor EF-Tu-like GTPase|uniref:hypothetical protein n=1 Tax=unclassified Azospirillum TaxID=2630922 RepID=UPI001178775A|nr:MULTISPECIES: hypothetical protein [unclassified Azospirillum]
MPGESEILINVKALIHLFSSEESGKVNPIVGNYRPNHNFFNKNNTNMHIGQINVPEGVSLHPEQQMEILVSFLFNKDLVTEIYPGRQWYIQEGHRVVGIGIITQIIE